VNDLANVEGVDQQLLDRFDGALGVSGEAQAGQAAPQASGSSQQGGVQSSDLSQ
jgi:hypothetical protein